MEHDSLIALCHKLNKQQAKKLRKDEKPQLNSALVWRKNQFKLFIWISVFYRYVFNKKIQELVIIPSIQIQNDYLFLNEIFPQQRVEKLKYELLCLDHSNFIFKKVWAPEEISLLTMLMENNSKANNKV